MVSERIEDIVNKIIPINCEAYLKSKSWRLAAKMGDKAHFFEKTDEAGESKRVFVPLNTDLSGYANRIYELVNVLQEIEERSFEHIANDIILSNYDIFRITAFKGDDTDSLLLGNAATLLDRSLALITAAAQSIIKQQTYFQKPAKEVSDFINKLRLGHTERGSFIVSIQTPIIPNIMKNDDDDELFERKVTTRLCSLISRASIFANSIADEDIKQSVSVGMSSNFIEALADITNICGNAGASLDMAWSPIRPCREKSSFHVKKETVDILREIGKVLKTKMPENNIELEGYVTTLHRIENAEIGDVKIRTADDSARVIHLEGLCLELYNKIMDAHRDDKIVVLKGDLTTIAKKTMLKNVTLVDVKSN